MLYSSFDLFYDHCAIRRMNATRELSHREFRVFAEPLTRCRSLTQLRLEGMVISPSIAEMIAKVLESSLSLRGLSYVSNSIISSTSNLNEGSISKPCAMNELELCTQQSSQSLDPYTLYSSPVCIHLRIQTLYKLGFNLKPCIV